MNLDCLDLFRELLFKNAFLFKKTFQQVESEFGDCWRREFDLHLGRLFGKDEKAYYNAVRGYTSFAIDAMRLQALFNKELKYRDITYDEACDKVYMNEDYMMNLYLPGIFVSHFLWRHHYRQFMYYKNAFLPLCSSNAADDKKFYEVGTGTGFYTAQVFRHDRDFLGFGIDISPYSREFTLRNIRGWGYESSFASMNLNIIGADLEPLPCIQTVEVLEHLNDPQLFLRHLRRLLRPGGHGFIAAALAAPQADHIYLYWSPQDVMRQLAAAGFTVDDYASEPAYEGQPGEYVPTVAAFIVS